MSKIWYGALIIFFLILFPIGAHATEVGFVPSSGIWFSEQAVTPGEAVKVYAVIINNAYPSVQAEVVFYDNGDAAGTVSVDKLEKEQARELWISWTPNTGSHKITARFTRAIVTGLDGKQVTLDPTALNTIGESSFLAPASSGSGQTSGSAVGTQTSGSGSIGGQAGGGSASVQGSGNVNIQSASALVQNANTLTGDGVMVQVVKNGDKLILGVASPQTTVNAQTPADTVNSTHQITVTSGGIKKTDAASSTGDTQVKSSSLFATVLDKIKNAGETVRQAREITAQTFHQAQGLAEQGKARVEEARRSAQAARGNKIALAWAGFLGLLALSAFLSYMKWRRFR